MPRYFTDLVVNGEALLDVEGEEALSLGVAHRNAIRLVMETMKTLPGNGSHVVAATVFDDQRQPMLGLTGNLRTDLLHPLAELSTPELDPVLAAGNNPTIRKIVEG